MIFDVVIIGSGPAGYTAGIYAARAGLVVMLLEGESWGGQLMTTTTVENFPGFAAPINGFDLMDNMRKQCAEQNCKLIPEVATKIERSGYHYIVHTSSDKYKTKTAIIATGATAKKLNFDEFWNKGISACAVCDGALPMFRNKPLAVVGGGDTACEEALFLTAFASKIYMIVRSKLRASQVMQKRVLSNPKIEILYETEVRSVKGSKLLEEITLSTGQVLTVSGMFYAIGHTPNSDICDFVAKDKDGYIITRDTQTNHLGLFACGDVQDKVYRQAITAAASGCQAAMSATRYVQEINDNIEETWKNLFG